MALELHAALGCSRTPCPAGTPVVNTSNTNTCTCCRRPMPPGRSVHSKREARTFSLDMKSSSHLGTARRLSRSTMPPFEDVVSRHISAPDSSCRRCREAREHGRHAEALAPLHSRPRSSRDSGSTEQAQHLPERCGLRSPASSNVTTASNRCRRPSEHRRSQTNRGVGHHPRRMPRLASSSSAI